MLLPAHLPLLTPAIEACAQLAQWALILGPAALHRVSLAAVSGSAAPHSNKSKTNQTATILASPLESTCSDLRPSFRPPFAQSHVIDSLRSSCVIVAQIPGLATCSGLLLVLLGRQCLRTHSFPFLRSVKRCKEASHKPHIQRSSLILPSTGVHWPVTPSTHHLTTVQTSARHFDALHFCVRLLGTSSLLAATQERLKTPLLLLSSVNNPTTGRTSTVVVAHTLCRTRMIISLLKAHSLFLAFLRTAKSLV